MPRWRIAGSVQGIPGADAGDVQRTGAVADGHFAQLRREQKAAERTALRLRAELETERARRFAVESLLGRSWIGRRFWRRLQRDWQAAGANSSKQSPE